MTERTGPDGASGTDSAVDSAVDSGGLVVFVCPHGVGKSRMAAAVFQAALSGRGSGDRGRWSVATAAGAEPGDALSPHASRLLAGDPAEVFLQPGAGRPLAGLPIAGTGTPVLVVGIDVDPAGVPAERLWRLEHQTPDEKMRDEIAGLVADLVDDLIGRPAPR